jgi:hypothetical protein
MAIIKDTQGRKKMQGLTEFLKGSQRRRKKKIKRERRQRCVIYTHI